MILNFPSSFRQEGPINSAKKWLVFAIPVILAFITVSAIHQNNATAVATQSQAWTKTLPTKITAQVFDEKNIFLNDEVGGLWKIDQQTGTITGYRHIDGSSSFSPIFIGEELLAVGSSQGYVVALRKDTLDEVWRFTLPHLFEPEMPIIEDDLIYFTDKKSNIYVLHALTGEQLWSHETKPANQQKNQYQQPTTAGHNFLYTYENKQGEQNLYVGSKKNGIILSCLKRLGQCRQITDNFPPEATRFTVLNKNIAVTDRENNLLFFNKISGNTDWQLPGSPNTQWAIEPAAILSRTGSSEVQYSASTGALLKKAQLPTHSRGLTEDKNRFVLERTFTHQTKVTNIQNQSTTVWVKTISSNCNQMIPYQTHLLLVCDDGGIHSLSKINGAEIWTLQLVKPPIEAVRLESMPATLFVIGSDSINNSQVSAIDIPTGSIIWQSPQISLKTETIYSTNSKIFARSTDNQTILQLAGTASPRLWPLSPVSIVPESITKSSSPSLLQYCPTNNNFAKLSPRVWMQTLKQRLFKFATNLKSQAITVSAHHSGSTTISIHSTQPLEVRGRFWQNSNRTISVEGFELAKDQYEIRFTPTQDGLWFWEVTTKNIWGVEHFYGSFTAENSRQFLEIKNEEWFEGNKPFVGIGTQTAFFDYNLDGDLLDHWPLANATNPTLTPQSATRYVSSAQYMETMAAAGFNIFRLSLDNNNFRIINCLSEDVYLPNQQTSLATDVILQQAQTQGLKVVFGIFGFHPFVSKEPAPLLSPGLKQYLDTIINRYAALVDVWELTNEASTSDAWIEAVTAYIKQHDPYQHPVTVSWERPEHTSIEITDLHYYDSEPLEALFDRYGMLLLQKQRFAKPTMVSEAGNSSINWDTESPLRFAHRNWLSTFLKSPIIWWDQATAQYENETNANIYIGPFERNLVMAQRQFAKQHLQHIIKYFQVQNEKQQISLLGIETQHAWLLYSTNPTVDSIDMKQLVDILGNAQKNWQVSWFDTQTGTYIPVIQKQHQILTKPSQLGVLLIQK